TIPHLNVYRIMRNKWYRRCSILLVFAHLSLAFFEQPCRPDLCLPYTTTWALELVVYFLYIVDFLLTYYTHGKKFFFQSPRRRLGVVLLAVAILNILIAFSMNEETTNDSFVILPTRLTRPFWLLCFFPRVRTIFRTVFLNSRCYY